MSTDKSWTLKVRVKSPGTEEPVIVEIPMTDDQWRRIENRAREAGMTTETWISQNLVREFRDTIYKVRSNFRSK